MKTQNRPELKVIIDGIEYEPKPKQLLADAKVGNIAAVETKHGNIVYKPIFHVTDDYVYAGENGKINVGYKYRKIDGINELDNRFKIVSFEPLAPEGTAEWAWQMNKLLGKKVMHPHSNCITDGNIMREHKDIFLAVTFPTGWQLYEPDPEPAKEQFKVGDWVRTEDGDGKFMAYARCHTYDNSVFFSVDYVTYDAFIRLTTGKYEAYPVSSLVKLHPSEVVVPIRLRGKVCSYDGNNFQLTNIPSGFNNIIAFDALDAPTRELVESLLKAQEEK